MLKSTLTMASPAISSLKHKLPTPLELVSGDTAIAQLESEVAEVEKYEQDLLAQKQQQQQEIVQEKVTQGIQQLETLANNINTLAMLLEAEMFNFKEIVVEVNQFYHDLQQLSKSQLMEWNESTLRHFRPLNIWEVHHSSIPIVVKQGTKFILTSKIVNLFKAEQEFDVNTKARTAQKRRKALEIWLTNQSSLKQR